MQIYGSIICEEIIAYKIYSQYQKIPSLYVIILCKNVIPNIFILYGLVLHLKAIKTITLKVILPFYS